MKIGYVAFLDYSFLGVKSKIEQQIETFQKHGVSIIPIIVKWSKNTEDLKIGIEGYIVELKESYNVLLKRFLAIKKISKIIEQERIDILYIRYPISDPFFYLFMRNITIPVITEHQTKELEEINKWSARYISERIFGPKVLQLVAGIVAVTKEIGQYESKRANRKDMPICVMGNGIAVKDVPENKSKTCPGKMRLLFVGQVAKWHGLDRLVIGLEQYKGEEEVSLSIVGSGQAVPFLKKMVTEKKLEDKVVFHSTIYGKKLDITFEENDIAVGSLGIHRKGLTETSELKAREYCARGMPFLCSSVDADFEEQFIYKMKISSDDKPVDIEAVLNFGKTVLSDCDYSKKMRQYANENLEWQVKIGRLIEYIENILRKASQ